MKQLLEQEQKNKTNCTLKNKKTINDLQKFACCSTIQANNVQALIV